MSTVEPQVQSRDQQAVHNDEMDWDAYAAHYDEMCALNPAYQANINMLLERMRAWSLPAECNICDLGAGTGNYILQMAKSFPDARYWHVDFDERMAGLAKQKYVENGLGNVTIMQSNVHNLNFEEGSFDLVVCINALYAFSSQEQVLRQIRTWLKPSGKLFLIDFGRRQRTLDWALYLFKESMKSKQIGRYARSFIEGREVFKQNLRTAKGQESGRYWLHTTQEFGESLQKAGYRVEELSRCYRNYSDLAVCSKD